MAEKGAKVKFTAETGQFNESIKKSNAEIKQMKAELNLASKQMSRTGETVEGLENKHKLLEQQLSASESKTEALTQKINKAIECFGEESTEVMNLRTQLANAKSEQEKFKISLDACNKKLTEHRNAEAELNSETNKLTRTIDEQQSELNRLKSEYVEAALKYGDTSDEARKLANEIDDLSGKLKQNKTTFSDASKKADELDQSIDGAGDAASNSSGGFTVMKGALADLTSEAIQWGIEKISEFTQYLADLPDATKEFRQDMSTLETSFEKTGKSVETAQGTWKDLYAVFGEDDRAVETANHISKIADNQQELNDWVTITTGVWGTYQDSLPVEGLAEASMESAKTAQVTGVLADALNWGAAEGETFGLKLKENIDFTKLSSSELAKLSDEQRKEYEAKKKQYEETEKFNKTLTESASAEDIFNLALAECSDEQERQQLITDTLNRLYGDAAETYRETSKSQMEAKEATAEHMQAEAELAEIMEPVTTEATELKTQFLEGLKPAIEDVSKVATDALQWMQEHPTAMKAIGAAVGVLAIGIGGLALAVGIYTAAQWAMNSALLANPITWIVVGIVAAIAALVGIGVALYENWDVIKKKCSEMWSSVTGKFKDLKNKVVNYATDLKDKAVAKWNDLKSKTISIFTGAKDKAVNAFSTMKSKVVNFVSNIATSVRTKFDNIKNSITEKINTAKDKVTEAVGKIKKVFDFDWKLPKPKIPKFTVSGGEAPWGFGGHGKLPSVKVKWNKDGFIVKKASFIGQLGDTMMGAGEAGPEALTPISVLQDYINRAFERNINNYALAGGGSDVYNFYVNDAVINDDAEMQEVARNFITKIVRLGGMN